MNDDVIHARRPKTCGKCQTPVDGQAHAHHHEECFDGSGNPRGLAGEAIFEAGIAK